MTFRTTSPMCPDCGHAMTTEEMLGNEVDLFALAPNEGRTEIVCPNVTCGSHYHCQGSYRPEYTSAMDECDL